MNAAFAFVRTQMALRAYLGVTLLLIATTACSNESPTKTPVIPPTSTLDTTHVPTVTPELDPTPTPVPAVSDTSGVCAKVPEAPPSIGGPTKSASPRVSFSAKENTIVVSPGDQADLPAISASLNKPELLSQTSPGEWMLSANILVAKDASLSIAGPDVRRLKLSSSPGAFVWIKTVGGKLSFSYTCVTSWDTAHNTVAASNNDGRSFVLARDQAELNIDHSELSYLGYDSSESYGVALRLGTTGKVINSMLAYNFYGLYTYQSSSIVIRGNEVHHSIRYGIDPHTKSNGLLIENNVSHHNGKQGLILAEDCTDSVIRNNVVYSNTMNGIELYQRSDNNLVEGNTAYGNGQLGINVNGSFTNTVRDNTVYNNNTSGIGVGQGSSNNSILNNTVRGNSEHGIYVFGDARANVIGGNTVSDNSRYGIYVVSQENKITEGNTVFQNAIGVYLKISNAPAVSRDANRIYNNRVTDVRTGTG